MFQASPDSGEVVSSQSVWEFFVSGGVLMIPILICSVVALAISLERYLALRREKVIPAAAQEAVVAARDGRYDHAWEHCEAHPSAICRILQAGLRRRGRRLEDVERGMEDQAGKEFDRLRGRLRPLAMLANITPLLGLLGTVVGIQESFHRVGRTGLVRPENLPSDIEVALVTTIAGLSVAIPCLLVVSWFQARVRQYLEECDDLLSPLVEGLAEPGEKQDAA
jgi:biopolymer transport protein ExbB